MNSNPRKPLIKLENVSFVYGLGKPNEHAALKDINLEIYPGEYVSFLGPSGCGKSTLLYIIAGMDKPTTGRVLINGRDITQMSGKELAIYRQIGIGIIFQNFNLIPSISVKENIMMPMAFLGVTPDVRKKKADEILSRLNLDEMGHRYPFELSGGQQQRVGIARALVNEPPLMLADEPLGNLDSENANKVLEFLKDLNHKYHKTVIMVTHESWSLRDVSKIFHMLDGKIMRVEDKLGATETCGDSITNGGVQVPSPTPEEIAAKEIEEKKKVARSMSHLLMRGYSLPEIERMEKFLSQFLEESITREEFISNLDKPFKEGGVGLWRQKAKKVGEFISETLEKQKDLVKIQRALETNTELPLYEEIREIRDWLLKDSTIQLDSLHYIQLQEIISERIRGIITDEHFRNVMNLPRKSGGLGFSIRTALKLSEKMESLLGGTTDLK